ncbi:carbon starvation protein A [bacterium]|nr:carbon starvation protein A [bacterium]
MITFLIGLAILGFGGFAYGLFVERFFGVTNRTTPAVTKRDGVDYVPMASWRNGLIHLLNIAGTGPILGPIQGILFGPVAFITIPLGCILAGAVQDYMVGMMSVRNDGEQIQSLVRDYLGKKVAVFFGVFVCLAVLLFGVTCVYTPGDIFIRSVMHQEAVLSNSWLWAVYGVIFAYYLIATLMPIDKIIGRVYPFIGAFFIFTALLLFIYIFIMKLPLTELSLENWKGLRPHFFPIFFVTVACGIASGFHATQATIVARTIKTEKSGRFVFYNMMLLEGFIAMIWAAVTMGCIKLFNIDANQSATALLSAIVSHVTEIFRHSGNASDRYLFFQIINAVVVIGVIVLPITSGDTALRGCRLMLGEMLGMDQRKARNRVILSFSIFAMTAMLLLIAKFSTNGFNLLWRYFAWANQTIVAFSLGTATAWCIREGKRIWVTVLPGAFYLAVTSSFILNAKIGFNLPWNTAYPISGLLAVAYICYFIYEDRKSRAVSNSK